MAEEKDRPRFDFSLKLEQEKARQANRKNVDKVRAIDKAITKASKNGKGGGDHGRGSSGDR